jgi:hypothetical protein
MKVKAIKFEYLWGNNDYVPKRCSYKPIKINGINYMLLIDVVKNHLEFFNDVIEEIEL